jgi:hypothetical protein
MMGSRDFFLKKVEYNATTLYETQYIAQEIAASLKITILIHCFEKTTATVVLFRPVAERGLSVEPQPPKPQ